MAVTRDGIKVKYFMKSIRLEYSYRTNPVIQSTLAYLYCRDSKLEYKETHIKAQVI